LKLQTGLKLSYSWTRAYQVPAVKTLHQHVGIAVCMGFQLLSRRSGISSGGSGFTAGAVQNDFAHKGCLILLLGTCLHYVASSCTKHRKSQSEDTKCFVYQRHVFRSASWWQKISRPVGHVTHLCGHMVRMEAKLPHGPLVVVVSATSLKESATPAT
jgi:hypothetical protein